MAIDLAQLVVSMEANTAKFQKDMDRVNRKLDKFSLSALKSISDVKAAFSKIFAATGVAVAVRGLAELERGALEFGSSIADTALQAGIGVESFQELAFGAVQMGLSADKLSGALVRLSVNIGNARVKGDEAEPAFQRLGVALTDANGAAKSNEAIFREVVSGLRKIQDPATRAALAFELFGREAGPKFAELIAGGVEGLDEYAKAAHQSGAVLDAEFIGSIKKTSDEIAVLDRQISVNLTRAFGTNEPILKLWKETLESATSALAAWRSENVKSAEETAIATALFGGAVTRNTEVLRGATKAAADYLTVLENIRTLGAPTAPPVPFADFPAPGPMNVGTPETEAQRKDREAAKRKREADALRESEAALRAHLKLLEDTRQQVLLLEDAEGEEAKMRALVNELYAKGKIPQDAYLAFLAESNQRIDEFGMITEATAKKLNVFADQAARNIQSFTASLVDAAMAGENMADTIVAALRRIAAEMLTSMLLQSLGNSLSGSSNPFLANLGKGLAGARADGGPVSGGGAYLVGEEGPELFVPRASGNIVPNGSFGGRGKVEINVDARGADPTSTANMMRALADVERRIYENFQRGTGPVA